MKTVIPKQARATVYTEMDRRFPRLLDSRQSELVSNPDQIRSQHALGILEEAAVISW